MFAIPILALTVISALTYYGVFNVILTVNQPISTEGDLTFNKNCDAGSICLGTAIKISNSGTSNKVVSITNDNTDGDIEVGYVGELSLTSKDLSLWTPTTNLKAVIYYTVLDDTFSWRYKSNNFNESLYTLIYYMDDDSNVDTADRLVTLGLGDSTITTKLPRYMDWNRDADPNYCLNANGFDSYAHCYGAKLWLVPTTAITGSTVDWSQASGFLFETDLIWYSDSATELTVPANSFIEFYPQFDVDEYATGGTTPIEITIA